MAFPDRRPSFGRLFSHFLHCCPFCCSIILFVRICCSRLLFLRSQSVSICSSIRIKQRSNIDFPWSSAAQSSYFMSGFENSSELFSCGQLCVNFPIWSLLEISLKFILEIADFLDFSDLAVHSFINYLLKTL